MHFRATSVRFLRDVTVELTFQDGKVVRFDMSTMFDKYPQLKQLKRNRALFENGHLDAGGFAIVWNEELDFDTTSIYCDGIFID